MLTNDFKDYYFIIIEYINQYGIIKTKIFNDILKELEKTNIIIIKREPPTTFTGKKSRFILPQKNQKTSIKLVGEK